MDDVFKQIIKYNNNGIIRIDKKLLNENFLKVPDSFTSTVRWSMVTQLYMVGKSASLALGVQSGIYKDKSGKWMLVVGATAEDIGKHLPHCSILLEKLSVVSTEIRELDVGHLIGLNELHLEGNHQLSEVKGLKWLGHLEVLCLHDSKIQSASFSHPLVNLRQLNLRYNEVLQGIHGLDNLPRLEYLDLGFTAVKRLDLSRPLPKLRVVDATYSHLEDAACLTMFPNAEEIYLRSTGVSEIPSLEGLAKLQRLDLMNCPITTLDSVAFPNSLNDLQLDNTKIVHLPDTIRYLNGLEYLELCRLNLKSLPDWLPELRLSIGRGLGYGINLEDTTVEGVDMSIFDQPQKMIEAWFEERKSGGARPLNELKVVFLGDGGAGKSRTIARLLEDGKQTENFPNVSTPGIVIQDKEYKFDDRTVQVHFWDFGGQDILHSMHRMFLTERTLYVVMLNVRDGTQTERGRYWLHNLRSFAGGAPVLLVLNQIDTNRNASVNQTDLRAMYPHLTEVIAMSALEDDPKSIQNNLIAAMKRQIAAFPTLESPFLPAWSRLKDRLRTMKDYYIRGNDFNRFCEECGVEDSGETRLGLLRWFSDLGVSFHYGSSRKLKDFVILRPDWLTNAVYTIIFNKSDQLKNGLISHEAIYALLNPADKDREKIRSAFPEMQYNEYEVGFVLDVIRKFRLSFRVGDDTEFIPMLCQANSLSIALEYQNDPDTLEFRMEYEYLPNNVLHRLMVDLRRDLDTDQVWLTGALFRQKSNGLSAVVKTEGDVLRIFVRGENTHHRPHTYLNIIRDTLAAIHRDMGLKEPKELVVYKKGRKTEKFSYKQLLGTLNSGVKEIYSEKWDRMISIQDILDQTDREVERQKKVLLDVVAAACIRLQSKKILWKASEDDRNTDLRDLLRSARYQVVDQSLIGVGAGGKRAGEVDLLILNEQNLPWMACEAMNIESEAPSQLKYWDQHMDKLLVNYNPVGMQDLILISYVTADADKFAGLWSTYSEHMRWYDPPKVIRRAGTYQEIQRDNYNCLRIARCTYDRGGMPTTVHHYFLRLGL